MKKRHTFVPSLVATTAFLVFSGLANAYVVADTDSWDYSSSDYGTVGSYTPLDGDMYLRIYDDDTDNSEDYLKTRVDFNPTIHNVNSINEYNIGNGTGGDCYNENAYWTLDVTSIGDNPNDYRLDAFNIITV